jgi:hypothetical protein
MVEKKVSI